jgi:hypothetical protein
MSLELFTVCIVTLYLSDSVCCFEKRVIPGFLQELSLIITLLYQHEMHVSLLQGNIWESSLLDQLREGGLEGVNSRSAVLGKYDVV